MLDWCWSSNPPVLCHNTGQIECDTPVNTGYIISEVNVTTGASFSVSAVCAAGYGVADGDEIEVEPCTATQLEYTLEGCEPIVCTHPAAAPGYEIPSTANNLDLSSGDLDLSWLRRVEHWRVPVR
jgi:hypothetical protein